MMMHPSISLHNWEQKQVQDARHAEWEGQQRSQWKMPGYGSQPAAVKGSGVAPQNSGGFM